MKTRSLKIINKWRIGNKVLIFGNNIFREITSLSELMVIRNNNFMISWCQKTT